MFEELQIKGVYTYFKHNAWIKSTSKKTIKVYSPNDFKLAGEIQAVTKEEADEVIRNCSWAQQSWNSLPIQERASYLYKTADLAEKNYTFIAQILMKENGKSLLDAEDEVLRSAALLRQTAEEGLRLREELLRGDAFPQFRRGKLALVRRVPFGVVLAIAPFNYPINLAVSKIAPALITGNTVVVKAPTQGAISLLHFVELFRMAGLPPGVLNVITGSGSEIGDYLVQHNGVHMIAFTGSTKVGKRISQLAGINPLLLELGGKDAAIVLEDADLDLTVKEITAGAFSYAGQRCTAIKRVFVLDSIADRFAQKLVTAVEHLRVGSGEDTVVCPLISKEAGNYIQELVDDANKHGAKQILCKFRNNNLWSPVIFDHVNEQCRILWEEQFGPVLPIMRVKTAEEAIALTNRSEYGLAACVFTKDIEKALKIADQLDVGTVQINGKSARGPDHFPFPCIKSSGLGTQGIKYSIEAMTRIKNVVLNLH
ncbi:NADP-dependent glyceraldehyde-3-phosphate dehydrogenase [Candidatus Woesearchaeota archaeon]|nr:NADP-dependent glyceraldehyde-3-phosphate dehydrogenase [Candidatus Woesearchaeota archaeon]